MAGEQEKQKKQEQEARTEAQEPGSDELGENRSEGGVSEIERRQKYFMQEGLEGSPRM